MRERVFYGTPDVIEFRLHQRVASKNGALAPKT